MCGRYASFLPAEAAARIFGTANPLPNLAPSWNVASVAEFALFGRVRYGSGMKPMVATISAMGVTTLLAACAGESSGQAEITKALSAGSVQSRDCAARIAADRQFWPLAVRMPIDGGPASAPQSIDYDTPNLREVYLLGLWRDANARCRLATLAAVPDAVFTLQLSYAVSDSVLDALATGQMSWGDANSRMDAVAAAADQQIDFAVAVNRYEVAEAEAAVTGPFVQAAGDFLAIVAQDAIEGAAEGASIPHGGYHGATAHPGASGPYHPAADCDGAACQVKSAGSS